MDADSASNSPLPTNTSSSGFLFLGETELDSRLDSLMGDNGVPRRDDRDELDVNIDDEDDGEGGVVGVDEHEEFWLLFSMIDVIDDDPTDDDVDNEEGDSGDSIKCAWGDSDLVRVFLREEFRRLDRRCWCPDDLGVKFTLWKLETRSKLNADEVDEDDVDDASEDVDMKEETESRDVL